MALVKSKAERKAAQDRRNAAIQYRLKNILAVAERDIEFAKKISACYWLCSMLTVWIKVPKEKSNMVAIENYVLRSLNEEEKSRSKYFGTYP